ncbi:conserved exported hypothetical protein [Paraburkholderia sabiae]|uniref:T6SS immunity protein Tli4 family protein n=1 Tax=Paraburkholderia sabiae TaxID=273251 RepID=UPI001CB264AA|nr:T6SS immunity protein Tli4 family protein [Paraburkholderia sabiae]CAG9218702.1 conserved exported hypothetical protein [Paraburkholderia sabiae]
MTSGPVGSRLLRTTFSLLMIALSACARTATPEPMMKNHPLLVESRPWCIGRLLIDRPVASELHSEKYGYTGDAIEVTENVSYRTFLNDVNVRERELRTMKRTSSISFKEMQAKGLKSMIVDTGTPWLELAVSPSNHSRLMLFKELTNRPDSAFDGEGYVLAGSNLLSMKFLVGSNAVQKVTRDESDWYRNVTYRDDWSVPTERGFCIKGALIGGPSRNSELVEQSINLAPGKYALFLVKMRESVDVDPQSSLLKTLPALREKLRSQGHSDSVQVLREGKRKVAGMDAEEVLFSVRDGNLQLYRFYLIASGDPRTTAQPHTEIQLLLGQPPRDGLSQDQATSPVDEVGAIQVWDALLDSLRLRPGAM